MTATPHGFQICTTLLVMTLGLALAGPALAEKKGGAGSAGTPVDCASAETSCKTQCKVDNPKSETGAALCNAGCGSTRVICDLAHPKALRGGAGTVAPTRPLIKKN